MTSLSNRQFDQIAAAKERMISAALRGSISPPALPPGLVDSIAATTDFYDEPEPAPVEKIDPAAGRSTDEEDRWRQVAMSPEAVALRDVEEAALRVLDELREARLKQDEIPSTRSGEPTRLDVRANFYWQARG